MTHQYDEYNELTGGIIHFDDHLSGGLKGVSRASGFIQRSMAEMKKKEGKYTKGNIELPALNLKDGAKFDAKKITKQSPFLYHHITKGVPYENNRLNPILTTGQTAGVRIIDGKEQSFKQPDPKYNKHTLRFYPLPRAGLRKLTAKEEAQKKKAIDEYAELLKNAFPADFVKNPNATPKSSKSVSQKKGQKSKGVSRGVLQPSWTLYPARLQELLTEKDKLSPSSYEIVEKKYEMLTPDERNLPVDEKREIARLKYIKKFPNWA
jgi:hypothetical protein